MTLTATKPFEAINTKNCRGGTVSLLPVHFGKAEPEWLRISIDGWVQQNKSWGPIPVSEMEKLGARSRVEEGTDWVLIFTDGGLLRREFNGYFVTDYFLKRAAQPYAEEAKRDKTAAEYRKQFAAYTEEHDFSGRYDRACDYATITKSLVQPNNFAETAIGTPKPPMNSGRAIWLAETILDLCLKQDSWDNLRERDLQHEGDLDMAYRVKSFCAAGLLLREKKLFRSATYSATDMFVRLCLHQSSYEGVFTGMQEGPIVVPFTVSVDAFKEAYPQSPEFELLKSM